MKSLRYALLIASGVIACAAGSASAQQPSAAKGKEKSLAVGCFTCHGRAGQGGALNYIAPPLVGLNMNAEALAAFLRNTPGDMPPYAEAVLSNADVADVLAFIQSLPGRKDPKDFPLIQQMAN